MAELTTPGSSSAENQLEDQFDDVKIEMRKFVGRLDRMTNAAVYSEGVKAVLLHVKSTYVIIARYNSDI